MLKGEQIRYCYARTFDQSNITAQSYGTRMIYEMCCYAVWCRVYISYYEQKARILWIANKEYLYRCDWLNWTTWGPKRQTKHLSLKPIGIWGFIFNGLWHFRLRLKSLVAVLYCSNDNKHWIRVNSSSINNNDNNNDKLSILFEMMLISKSFNWIFDRCPFMGDVKLHEAPNFNSMRNYSALEIVSQK